MNVIRGHLSNLNNAAVTDDEGIEAISRICAVRFRAAVTQVTGIDLVLCYVRKILAAVFGVDRDRAFVDVGDVSALLTPWVMND